MTNIAARIVRTLAYGALPLVWAASPMAAEGIPAEQAETLVKNQACLDSLNVDAVLAQKISSSQRDLGWAVFSEDNGYTVERAFLLSKSMQLRFRWFVDVQGQITASSDRAANLCKPDA